MFCQIVGAGGASAAATERFTASLGSGAGGSRQAIDQRPLLSQDWLTGNAQPFL